MRSVCAENPFLWPLKIAFITGAILFFAISSARAEDRMEKAFRLIADYHLNVTSEEILFTHFTAALSAQDPAARIAVNEGAVQLLVNGAPVAYWPLPGKARIDWPQIGAGATAAAYLKSPQRFEMGYAQYTEAVLQKLLQRLDPYSHITRFNPREESFAALPGQSVRGSIGLSVEARQNAVYVYKTIENSPAASYLQKNDQIISIDGRDVSGLSAKDTVKLLWGELSESVNLRIARNGKLLELAIPRNLSREKDLRLHKTQNGVNILEIDRFTKDTAARVSEILSKEPARSLIVDLRGNHGGVLEEAVAVADLFLKDGLIVEMDGKRTDARQEFIAQDGIHFKMPMVVVIDGETASAAEVLAGTLQDNGRAIILGSTSYGKNTVQHVMNVDRNLALAISWAKLKLPKQQQTEFNGVAPDVCFSALQPLQKEKPPEPGKEFVWLRRAPQVTWNSRTCPKTPLDKNPEPVRAAEELLLNTGFGAAIPSKTI